MKLLVIILTLILSSYSFAESCDYEYDNICSADEINVRNTQLRMVNVASFKEINNSSEMEDLICKNFNRVDGKLVFDFLWNRSCWDWSYRRTYKKMGIETCDDFIIAGASNNFILNCHQLLSKQLVINFYQSLNTKTRRVIEKVKSNFLIALSSESYFRVVERKLRQIINMTHLERNLSVFKSEFIVAKDLCERIEDYNFCHVYDKSERVVLSLGAHALYNENDLEVFVARKIAQYIVDDIKFYENLNLQRVYIELLSDYSHQWKIENLLARSLSDDIMNRRTLEYLLMNKYLKASGNISEFRNSKSLNLLCPLNYQETLTKNEYYFDSYFELHPRDAMELMLCE